MEAEFAKAKRELLPTFETDMGPIERIRFRSRLWRLKKRFSRLRDSARW